MKLLKAPILKGYRKKSILNKRHPDYKLGEALKKEGLTIYHIRRKLSNFL